jgi:hypothetical protein
MRKDRDVESYLVIPKNSELLTLESAKRIKKYFAKVGVIVKVVRVKGR